MVAPWMRRSGVSDKIHPGYDRDREEVGAYGSGGISGGIRWRDAGGRGKRPLILQISIA
ncbi:protein of unknown function (plasmid) [Rhodovastum atsumiense]|nr:protein of unknown function [Rhodovastum atsumiense]